jgi:hypothetical protein
LLSGVLLPARPSAAVSGVQVAHKARAVQNGPPVPKAKIAHPSAEGTVLIDPAMPHFVVFGRSNPDAAGKKLTAYIKLKTDPDTAWVEARKALIHPRRPRTVTVNSNPTTLNDSYGFWAMHFTFPRGGAPADGAEYSVLVCEKRKTPPDGQLHMVNFTFVHLGSSKAAKSTTRSEKKTTAKGKGHKGHYGGDSLTLQFPNPSVSGGSTTVCTHFFAYGTTTTNDPSNVITVTLTDKTDNTLTYSASVPATLGSMWYVYLQVPNNMGGGYYIEASDTFDGDVPPMATVITNDSACAGP